MRSKCVPAHASICYKSRGLAAAPGPAAQGGKTRATQGDGYDAVVTREPHHGISLVGSGDPIIHMWIMGRCVCRYTARVASLCVLDVYFSLFRYLFVFFQGRCAPARASRRSATNAVLARAFRHSATNAMRSATAAAAVLRFATTVPTRSSRAVLLGPVRVA